jgi:Tfp pilus assembly ATPase PilU
LDVGLTGKVPNKMSTPTITESQPKPATPSLNFIALLRQMLKTSDKVSDLIFSLKSTMRTREYVEKGDSEGKSLIDAMEQGEQDGMQTFDTVIEKMVRDVVLTQEGALPYATNANNLLLRLGDLGGEALVVDALAASTEDDSMLNMIER